jgi:hypothetical protein
MLLLVLVLASLVVAAAVPVVAAPGDNMKVGRVNGAQGYQTSLYSTNPTATLTVVNNRGAGAPALNLRSKAGPALAVNTKAWIRNLNADYLDGRQASTFASESELVPFMAGVNEGAAEVVYFGPPFTVQVECSDTYLVNPDSRAEVWVTSTEYFHIGTGGLESPGPEEVYETTGTNAPGVYAIWSESAGTSLILDLALVTAESGSTHCLFVGSVIATTD